MKLKTTVAEDGLVTLDGDSNMSGDDQLEHDAAAAHALMQAMDEVGGHTTKFIQIRADTILREWGFDSGEVE